jgi:hypothetical protein
VIATDSSSFAKAYTETSNSGISGIFEIKADKGVFNFTDFIPKGVPAEEMEIKFSSGTIDTEVYEKITQ